MRRHASFIESDASGLADSSVARVDDVVELAPEQDHEQRRPKEPEPERRRHAELAGEQAAERRPDDDAAHDADPVDAADPTHELVRDGALADIMRVGLIIETITHLVLALTTSSVVALGMLVVFGGHAFVWGTT